mmetsp:Transcript_16536/g.46316  ORF Transcript_16536/g.46316 Transcript_16536/m.46316 type:complete len:268 (+) Transcript_16536:1-804(+)
MIAVSFFTSTKVGQLMAMSPLLRQLHQASMYYYVGDRPPPMLYMTDGGVTDCTAIVQLLWRRRERILLVLAAADPDSELGVLRTALSVAVQLRLASFYDPQDPRRNLDVLLEEFKLSPEQRSLHIGISYCFGERQERCSGDLIVVKNRLPPSCVGPVQRLIRRRDVQGDAATDDSDMSEDDVARADEEAFGKMRTDELGPIGCCDCCHLRGINWGPKFPHGTGTNYLWLSPHWCSSTMRLGYELSQEAIAKASSRKPLRAAWEDGVA